MAGNPSAGPGRNIKFEDGSQGKMTPAQSRKYEAGAKAIGADQKKTPKANEPYDPNQSYKASPSYQVPGSKANEKAGPRAKYGIGTAALSDKRKTPLNPVIDKRSVKQKLKDAQGRRN